MFKKLIRRVIRKLGFELQRYTLETSKAAQIKHLLDTHHIDLVLDVGANTGQYAEFIRECGYRGRIVSFEPLTTAYTKLKQVSNRDHLWDVAEQTAIGNQDGEVKINIASNSYSSSVLDMLDTHSNAAPNSVYCGSEVVKMRRLDTIAPKYVQSNTGSIFLKMDVQGFELQVLLGATNFLPLIQGIQTELSLVPLYAGQALFKEMLDKIESLGYTLWRIVPGFTDSRTGKLLQVDAIFFKVDTTSKPCSTEFSF